MIEDYIAIGSDSITLIFYLTIVFFIFEIKKRTEERTSTTWNFLLIAFGFLITARILNILIVAKIISFPTYSREFFVFFFSLFLLFGIIDFYRFLKDFTDGLPDKNIKPKREYKPSHKTKVYSNKLKKMESKIQEMGNKIKKGDVKVAEAAKFGERLRIQLTLLDKSFQNGYISKEAYSRGKKRIKKAYQNLKKKHL